MDCVTRAAAPQVPGVLLREQPRRGATCRLGQRVLGLCKRA